MNITQKITSSFLTVIILLVISIVSVFLFHISSIEDYKEFSNTLILENTLTDDVSELMEAYNAVSVAPLSSERAAAYNARRDTILSTFKQLDSLIISEDSRVAYQGLKNIILGIVGDLEEGRELLAQGDLVGSRERYDLGAYKRSYVESNVALLVLNELQYLDQIRQDIEKTYFIQLVAVGAWTLFIVLLVIAYSFIFSRKLTSPIKELFLAAQKVSQGEYHHKIPPRLLLLEDEVGSLAASFSAMLEKLNFKIDQAESSSELITEAKKHLENRNADLEKAQMATANLLEDLEDEKAAVEQRIKERTEDLEREKNKLLQVTSNMRGGAILFDKDKCIVFTNEMAHKILGLPSEETSSDHILKAFKEYFASSDIEEYLKRCTDGETYQVPEVEGGGKLYEIYFHALQNEHNDTKETIGYFILISDITEAKLLERSKSELVAVASHQLRTPLTAMRGNVEMLVDESYGKLNKEQHELLDDIEVSTIRLITMVNEMLDITKIEKGNLEMETETLNVKEILNSVINDLDTYAKRHEFEVYLDISDHVMIVADKLRVRQIFQNLIDNAIKYSAHPGKLEISSASKDGAVEIVFKDNGIGVPKIEQSKLFGRFYRASNTAKTSSSGSGLGLYIVKSIAMQLGGDITFESEENVGTTFFVVLPEGTN